VVNLKNAIKQPTRSQEYSYNTPHMEAKEGTQQEIKCETKNA
jgi:hypothetical protein